MADDQQTIVSPAVAAARLQSRRIRRGLTLPLVLLAVWWAAYAFGWTDSKLFVAPATVVETGARLLAEGELGHALGLSLLRDVAGLTIGASSGLVVGILLGLSRWSRLLIGPTLHTIKQISLFAWIPLIMVWFGLGEMSKIVFISLAAFFPVLLNTFEGVGSVSRDLVEVSRVFVFSRLQLIRHVVIPSAMPSIFTGFYLALIYSWLATLGAEYLLTSGEGIGNLLSDGRENFWMDQILVGIFIVGLVGFALNWLAAQLEKRLLRWRGPSALHK
ncbi:MAG: ABC transporter permease [Oxalicibacterium faecigallinarum]|uniref:ABC transporter permease n=1 Tax=Oxalicibacterium faecigallinarum TaxID=573741 RepID=UPI0028095A55|nr:ABC transporter permease [Oxalicibacterium faecigallinarum]MDQ7969417.1 ABC transporter permease [Oxalicibacterium faecigallinarum]